MDEIQSALDGMMALETFRRRSQNKAISIADIEETSAGVTKLSGQIRVDSPGEVEIPITFPAFFSEKPLLSFGGELKVGTEPVPGSFPTVSVVIGSWSISDLSPSILIYKGCKLLVVTTGHPTQRMFVHWHLEGIAYNTGSFGGGVQ